MFQITNHFLYSIISDLPNFYQIGYSELFPYPIGSQRKQAKMWLKKLHIWSQHQSDFLLYNIINTAIVLVIQGFALLLELLDEVPFLQRYKIQKRKVSWDEKKRALKLVFSNLFMFLLPINLIFGSFFKYFGIHVNRELPTVWVACLQIVLLFFIDDVFFYAYHRLLHSYPELYKRFHKIHHTFRTPFAMTSLAVSKTELFLQMLGSVISLVIIRPHLFVFWVWLAMRQLLGVEDHLGYEFWWSPTTLLKPVIGGASFHDWHHSRNRGNYASVFPVIDYVCGTYYGRK